MSRARYPSDPDASLFLFDFEAAPVTEAEVDTDQEKLDESAYTPPDAAERSRALDPTRSFLVQAPAGSGKTQLLTQRFLRLLADADKPDEIVAITFTNASAAEMRNRILDQLEQAEARVGCGDAAEPSNTQSLAALAHRAMTRSKQLGWQLLEQPSQLRILTIDAFCRSIALNSPLSWGQLSGLGGRLEPSSDATELYRRAASELIGRLLSEDGPAEATTRQSLAALLGRRDNDWKDLEALLVKMLDQRNRWFQDFVFDRDPDWDALRKRLEAPFCRAAQKKLERLADLLDLRHDGRERITDLARFACENGGEASPVRFKEREELLDLLISRAESKEWELLEDALEAHQVLARFLLTETGWRKPTGLQTKHGFPSTDDGREAKKMFGQLIEDLNAIEGLEAALAEVSFATPTRYTEDEWTLIQHCFRVLRAAAVELQLIFAQTGSVDFTEVAQIALRILAPENGFPPNFAIVQGDGIHHLLIDEFQDTSRSQHQLLSSLIAAWPDREGRSCFCVGDPMQSIYGFRQVEVELFERLKTHGLEMPPGLVGSEANAPFKLEFVSLRANFRTTPSLIEDLNSRFKSIFAGDDGSGVRFSPAVAARSVESAGEFAPVTEVRLAFTARKCSLEEADPWLRAGAPEVTRKSQLGEMVELIRAKLVESDRLRELAKSGPEANPLKFRIAVLGRTKKSLILVADALRKARISYRAIELVPLGKRPEVLDALSLARALMNPADRTAWLGVLRAPWCGLNLEQLHLLTSGDDSAIANTAVPTLLATRLPELYASGQLDGRAHESALRLAEVLSKALSSRATLPGLGANITLGTWLESVWKALGGEDTVDSEQLANLRLLWAALDKLPAGELDLMSSVLPAALDKLCALPDPAASSDYGVQLMTIHKSKGLEFEVVIVPDLESSNQRVDVSLISWLERGLAEPDAEEMTEFLIAPIQPKGEKRGNAKEWVDQVKRQREEQELRRLLYVAATRAREELHLFARPIYTMKKTEKSGLARAELSKPAGLLATAWPALGVEIEARFAEWVQGQQPLVESGSVAPNQAWSFGQGLIASMAATTGESGNASGNTSSYESSNASSKSSSNLLQMANPAPVRSQPVVRELRPTLLRRLPEGYRAPEFAALAGTPQGDARTPPRPRQEPYARTEQEPYTRIEGNLQSRVEGTAIHAFLERLTSLLLTLTPGQAGQAGQAGRALAEFLPAVTAQIRSHGLPMTQARRLAGEALAVVQRSLLDPKGSWILAPHLSAAAETRWTGMIESNTPEKTLRNLRVDRVFVADRPEFLPHPANPNDLLLLGPGTRSWWIIDYKTTDAGGADLSGRDAEKAFFETHRKQHIEQLALYARFLRGLNASPAAPAGSEADLPIYAGLYYPRLRLFDYWPA